MLLRDTNVSKDQWLRCGATLTLNKAANVSIKRPTEFAVNSAKAVSCTTLELPKYQV